MTAYAIVLAGAVAWAGTLAAAAQADCAALSGAQAPDDPRPVSYTHLTLPTIYSV